MKMFRRSSSSPPGACTPDGEMGFAAARARARHSLALTHAGDGSMMLCGNPASCWPLDWKWTTSNGGGCSSILLSSRRSIWRLCKAGCGSGGSVLALAADTAPAQCPFTLQDPRGPAARAGWRWHKKQSWRRNNVCAPPSHSWRSSAHPATQLGSEPMRATRRLATTVVRATSQWRRTVVAIVTCKTAALVRVWWPARRRLTRSVVAPTTPPARRASRRAATRAARPPSCHFGR